MIRNLISAANMSQATWFDHLGKLPVDQALWTGSPSILDPWPSPIPVFVLKIQVFPGCLSLDNLLFEWRISLWFPKAPAGLHCSVKPSRERLYLGCQPARRPSRGWWWWWWWWTLLNIWEFFFLILLHVANWTWGTRWVAVVDDALWRSSVACSW